MRLTLNGLRAATAPLLAVALLAAQPAAAAIVVGSFSGTVIAGNARGNFGYAAETDLTGQAITGTFRYDTDLLGADCAPAASFYGCFLGSGVEVTQTINGVTELFPSLPAVPGTGLAFNSVVGGLLLYDLAGDAVNLHTHSIIGTPASVNNERETALAFGLAPGAIGDTGNPVLTYDGTANETAHVYTVSGQDFSLNHSRIYQLTSGYFTQQSDYDFTVDRVSFSPAGVPEPSAWSLMILGFAGLGTALRQRRRVVG